MNKNQVNGALKDITGKAQEEAGKWVGNPTQQAKGVQKQVEGQAEKMLGDAQEFVQKANKAVMDAVNKR
jgi:uncharacterized protein YjbJ (UPF0337 family)